MKCENIKGKRSRERVISVVEFLITNNEEPTKERIIEILKKCKKFDESKDVKYIDKKLDIIIENVKKKLSNPTEVKKIKRKTVKKTEENLDKDVLEFLKRNRLLKKSRLEELNEELNPNIIIQDILLYTQTYPIKKVVLFTDLQKLENYFNSADFNFEDLAIFIPENNWLDLIKNNLKNKLSDIKIEVEN